MNIGIFKYKMHTGMRRCPKYGIEGNRLIDIFNKHKLKKTELDFLSIDIDGPDLEVFEEIGMKPKVVLLEGGMNYDFTIEVGLQMRYEIFTIIL